MKGSRLEHWVPGASGDWQKHLEGCPRCRSAWQRWQALEQALQQAPRPVSPPPGLMAQIRARLLVQQQAEQQQVLWWGKRFLAALLVLFIPWSYLTLWLYPQAARGFLVRVMVWRWWVETLWEVVRAGFFAPWVWMVLSLMAWGIASALAWLWWRWMQGWWRRGSVYARR